MTSSSEVNFRNQAIWAVQAKSRPVRLSSGQTLADRVFSIRATFLTVKIAPK